MSSGITLDLSTFAKGVDAKLAVTEKALPDVLNKGALTAIIGGKGVQGAIQRTPKANLATMTREKVARYVLKKLRARGMKVARGRAAGVMRDANGKFLKGSARRASAGLSKSEFDALVNREMAARRRARGYTAGPGWSNSAKALGGRGVKTNERFPRSKAAKGKGTKAAVRHLVATIENAAPAAVKIGTKALQESLNAAGRDMLKYAERKLQRAFNRR